MSKPVVAIVGFNGLLGQPIVKALTSSLFRDNYSLPIRIITRDISKAPAEYSSNSDLKFYEANDLDSYEKAYTGVDAVIDIRALAAVKDRSSVDAAKKASVKIYSTSDYGTDYYNIGHYGAVFQPKADAAAYVKKVGLQLVQFHTGFFTDLALSRATAILFIDPVEKVTNYPGDGSIKLTLTSLPDIGRAVAGTLSHPFKDIPEQLYINGDTISHAEIAKIYSKATGITFEHKPNTVEAVTKVADEHITNGTGLQGFLDILKAVSVGTKGNDFSIKSPATSEFANPGLFKWESVSDVASRILSKK